MTPWEPMLNGTGESSWITFSIMWVKCQRRDACDLLMVGDKFYSLGDSHWKIYVKY